MKISVVIMVSIIILFSNCKRKNTNQIDGKYYLLGMAKTDTSSKACLPIEGYMPSADSIVYNFQKDSLIAFLPGKMNDTLLAGTFLATGQNLTIRYFDKKNGVLDSLYSNFHFFKDTLKIISKKDKLVFYMVKI